MNRVTHVGYTSAVIKRPGGVPIEEDVVDAEYKFRPYEGVGNNFKNPRYGHVGEHLLRKSAAEYNTDTQLSLHGNPNPRIVSNHICKGSPVESPKNLSNITWAWAQFVDHQLDLTVNQSGESAETIEIPVPDTETDPEEDFYYPGRTITVTRSKFEMVDALNGQGPVRQHTNALTSYVDACNVYGTTPDMCQRLRALDGTGKMKTSMADNGETLLPYNTVGLHMDVFIPVPQESLFAAGDVRANENIALIAMHTIWVREHNRLCDELVADHPEWAGQDEMIFQHARRMVIGMQQQITFTELLPKILGPIPLYSGYDDTVIPDIATEFSTVGYRVGHTMLPDVLQIDEEGTTITLFEAFFNPAWVQANGIDNLLVGLSKTRQQKVDNVVVDSVRNQLFGPPTTTSMRDLAAINIQRGRDHGIPGYNAVRVAYGLKRINTWDEFPTTSELRAKMAALYSGPDVVDPWVGCIVESHLPGAEVGPLLYAIISDQALRIRSGDRFWFENDPALSVNERIAIRQTSMADVLNRNTAPGIEFQDDVFVSENI